MFVAYNKGRLIVVGFSKTLMAVWSEKRILSMGFENGQSLHWRCTRQSLSPAQNRSILSNECPGYSRSMPQDPYVTLTSKCNFPVVRSAATQTPEHTTSSSGAAFRSVEKGATSSPCPIDTHDVNEMRVFKLNAGCLSIIPPHCNPLE